MTITKQFIPKVEFKLPSIHREADMLLYFCSPRPTGWDWSHKIYNRHPELKQMLQGLTDTQARYYQCHIYVKRFRKQHKKELDLAIELNKKLWQPIEKAFLKTLVNHFETSYPERIKTITAYVSIIPIYPRDISRWSFHVSYFAPERVRHIACHEILHFVYFTKWKELFPKTKREELDQPHLVWRLSEILDPVMLNEHPLFKTYFDKKQNTYNEFQNIKIGGKKPLQYFTHMYRKHLISGRHIDNFLTKSWNVAQKYKDILMSA